MPASAAAKKGSAFVKAPSFINFKDWQKPF